MKKTILMVAGEASGDLHGASLIRELRKTDPSLDLFGIGGSLMEKEGLRLVAHASDISVTGIFEVFFRLKKIISIFFGLLQEVDQQNSDLAILIDFPDFNLRLAKCLYRRKIPIIYYISPQLWAWRKRRVDLIRKYVNRMLVVFPFEVEFYRQHGIDAYFVGHPLCNPEHKVRGSHPEAKGRRISEGQSKTIALVPGSRKNEIHYLLDPMLVAAKILYKKYPALSFVLPLASTLNREDLESKIKVSQLPIQIIEGKFHETISSCDIAVTCSGTATLETAILGKPMVIVYRLNWISYLIGRLLIRNLSVFGMPNILLGEKAVPELLQSEVTGENICREVEKFILDRNRYDETSKLLGTIREKLGALNASQEVARHVGEVLGDSHHAKKMGMVTVTFLRLLSKVYANLVTFRLWLYRQGFLEQKALSTKVISIGNITVGGTGKTPFTIFLARLLKDQGKKVVILSRGYKRKSGSAWACVTDGDHIFLSPSEAGDEPYLMAKSLSQVPIYVGKNRFQVAEKVLKERRVDVFLLDDGFQHLGLKRDLDIVLIDATQFDPMDALLPLGRLREPVGELKRASHFVLTRTELVSRDCVIKIKQYIEHIKPAAIVMGANLVPQKMKNIFSDEKIGLKELHGQRVVGFCGIGNPYSFKKLLENLEFDLIDFKIFRDHFKYRPHHIEDIVQESRKKGADCIMTTQKDAVRLLHLAIPKDSLPMYSVDVDVQVTLNESVQTFLDSV